MKLRKNSRNIPETLSEQIMEFFINQPELVRRDPAILRVRLRADTTGNLQSEITKPRVRKPRDFINFQPDPPPKPPNPTLQNSLSIVLCTPAHSHTRRRGVAIYENPGFPVSKPGVSQSQVQDLGDAKCPIYRRMLLGFQVVRSQEDLIQV